MKSEDISFVETYTSEGTFLSHSNMNEEELLQCYEALVKRNEELKKDLVTLERRVFPGEQKTELSYDSDSAASELEETEAKILFLRRDNEKSKLDNDATCFS